MVSIVNRIPILTGDNFKDWDILFQEFIEDKFQNPELTDNFGMDSDEVKSLWRDERDTWRSANVCTPRFGITRDPMVRST